MNIREEAIEIKAEYTIRGTLSLPEDMSQKYPVVIIVNGSGEVDRNGCAGKKKLQLNSYIQIAELINGLGFAAFRYDKRGIGESEGDYISTGYFDLVNDLIAVVNGLKALPQIDPEQVILLGHSEGCMLSTTANGIQPVNGLILLSGAAETLKEATDMQRDMAMAEMMRQKGFNGMLCRLLKMDKIAEKQNAKYMDRLMKSDKDVMQANFQKINAKLLREHFLNDNPEAINKATCPVLAVTGSKDVQVHPENAKKIAALPQGEWHIVENMDHILKEFHGEPTILNIFKQYRTEEAQPLHPELAEILKRWLAAHYTVKSAG